VNMSHCRFQNTLSDLRDCCEALGEANDLRDLLSEMHEDEAAAVPRLVAKCRRVVALWEVLSPGSIVNVRK